MAKRHPAAAISQNQNGRETAEEPDLEVPGEVGVREGVVVISVIVAVEGGGDMFVVDGIIDVDNGLNEVDIINEEEVRTMLEVEDGDSIVTREEASLVVEEDGLEGVPVVEELDDDSVELVADVEVELELDVDVDEPDFG